MGGFINALAFIMAAGMSVFFGMSGDKADTIALTLLAAINLCCFIAQCCERK